MSDELNIDTTVFDEEYEQQQLGKALKQGEAERQAAAMEAEQTKVTPPQQQKETKGDGKFLGGMMEDIGGNTSLDPNNDGVMSTDEMGGKQRAVAGAIDTAMDLTSKFIPAMQDPADWWDEKTGRKTSSDPYKKAERDMAAVVMPMLLTGGIVGGATKAAGLTGKTKLLTDATINFGVDALISATSDTTSDAGNFGSLMESGLQKIVPGASIPWASRDGESPDVIFWKNMAENMVLSGLDPLVTALYAGKGGNKIIPKNDTAKAIVEAKPEPPTQMGQAIQRALDKKKAEQLKLGKRALEADPEGVNGYNAFVNEPAEPTARITLDEEGNAVDFMADQARIQNNVGTSNGRARPIIDNDTQELLARADAGTRQNILSKVETDLRAEFDVSVGGKKLSAREVQQSINNLYDAAIAPIGKSFDDAVKQFRNLELTVGNMTDTVTSRGGRKVIGKTIDRLVNAMSPQRQRTSAVIQTQAAAGVADISRNIDLMESVVDTSRLQELMLPRLKVLLKEQATAQVSESMSTQLQRALKKKVSTIEGAVKLSDKDFNQMFDAYTQAVDAKAQLIDDFVDELGEMAKQNPSFLKPVYRLYAKTNGDVDSMYKLNQYLGNRLGVLRKSIVDQNPEVPSLILRELQATRTANLINGTAPATAWVGNLAAVAIRPVTQLSGSLALGATTGNFAQLRRSLVAFSQIQETLRRASKMARDEWRYVNSNPDAAMARGRKDYDFSDANKDWKGTLADFEEMEDLYDTMSPARKALWNLTKGLSGWNRKNFNRWGLNAMYSADGFVKSMMASMNSRFQAYDQAISEVGILDNAKFTELEQKFYNEAFDSEGMIKDGYAKYASEEIALNADNKLVATLEKTMDQFPIMKSIFMFPRTKANAISVIQTFDPVGALSLWRDKSFKVLSTSAGDSRAVKEVLEMHGMAGGSVDDFLMLKSEYIGRKLAASGVVTGAAMATVAGNMTGSGSWMSPAEKKRAQMAGWRPYTIFGKSYEKAPDWMRMFMSLTSDITMAHFGTEGTAAQDWFGTMRDAIVANVSNEMFGSEMESLSELINMGPGNVERYLAGMVDTALIPGAGVRSALNDVLAPQLFDVEDNFQSYLANRNRFITQAWLTPATDPFTGNDINGAKYPLEKFMGRFMPFWESAGGDEPWRKWMLGTGWTGLSEPMTNPYTGEKLTPDQRQWINNWIGKNGNWDKEMEQYMKWDDRKFEKEWKAMHGNRAKLDISKSYIHEILDESKQRQFNNAWDAYLIEHPQVNDERILQDARDAETKAGNYDEAVQTQELLEQMKSKY